MVDAGWAFVRRAGTLILASMVLVWALLYFPRRATAERRGRTRTRIAAAGGRTADEAEANDLHGEWKRQQLARPGRAGDRAGVRPLGWDWRIGMAALASFPAREVVVGTLGIIYNQGDVDGDEERVGRSASAIQRASGPATRSAAVYPVPVALSLMVFFALCCQCASTLAVIRRETRSWAWPAFTFVYMTVLAYVGGAGDVPGRPSS